MEVYKEGNSYFEFIGQKEGVYLSIDGSGLLLTVLFDRPTAKECRAFDARRPMSVCALRKYDLLVLLTRFDDAPWMDCTYTPHIGAAPELEDVPDGAGYSMLIRLFDTRTGTLKKMRFVGLGTEISREIKRIVDEIAAEPFTKQKYENQLDLLYSIYQTEDLLREEHVRWDV